MSTNHTPTPWEVQLANSGARIVESASSRLASDTVVICSGLAGNRYNAHFIVRACNRDHLFDELVAALRLSLKVLDALAMDDDCTEGQPEATHAVRAALAKVQA